LAQTSLLREVVLRPPSKAQGAKGQGLTSIALSATLTMGMFVLTSGGAPQNTPGPENPTYSGTWTAAIGESRTLHGRWIGQAIPGDPSSAHGSWTLTAPQGKTVLTGTWSAHKTAQSWRGTWSAKTANGRNMTGNWQADLPADPKSTLGDMLERLSSEVITGTWRSGRLAGSWLLKGKARLSPRL